MWVLVVYGSCTPPTSRYSPYSRTFRWYSLTVVILCHTMELQRQRESTHGGTIGTVVGGVGGVYLAYRVYRYRGIIPLIPVPTPPLPTAPPFPVRAFREYSLSVVAYTPLVGVTHQELTRSTVVRRGGDTGAPVQYPHPGDLYI